MSMLDLMPIFAISFIGIYLNIWFFLNTMEKLGKDRVYSLSKNFKKLPKLSILIPAYNEAGSIRRTLKSILSADYPKSKMEVIVVDNNSTDRTADIARKFPGVKVLSESKRGKSFALEKGFDNSDGEIIGILDADTIVSKSSLKKMIVRFADPSVGAVTNMIRVDRKRGILEKFQHLEYAISGLMKKLLSTMDSLYITPGTLSLIRRKAAKKVGFSNDTLTEDMDFALGLIKKNYKIFHCMDAQVKTVIPKTLKEWGPQRIRWYRGYLENMIKHRDLIFNNKHAVLGWFVIPIAGILAIVIGVLMTSIVMGSYGYGFAIGLRGLAYIPFTEQLMLMFSFLPFLDVIYNPYTLFLFTLIFFSSMAAITYSTKLAGGVSKREMLLIPVYMMFYYTLIMMYWIVSLVYEVARWERKW